MSSTSSASAKASQTALTATNKSLAPVLGTRKDGQATASSARGLLLTVLGELVLPNGGTAWTQTLIEVLAGLDVEEKAARQAISRLAERGWLSGTKIGRRTRWSLTPEVQQLLEVGAARIYAFGQDSPAWSGEWLLLSASVPERNRSVRYQLTSGLNWAGFGALGQGWWISPRSDRESEAQQVLTQAGVDDITSFIARQGSMGDPVSLAKRAWNLDEVHSDYEDFLIQANGLASNATLENKTRSPNATDIAENALPGNATPGNATPGNTIPDATIPDDTVIGFTAPDAAPDTTARENTTFDQTARGQTALVEEAEPSALVEETAPSAEAVRNLVQLVHYWRRFPFLDPDLPAELLPSDWPGHIAAKRFRELHDLWSPPAQQWWQDTQTRFSR